MVGTRGGGRTVYSGTIALGINHRCGNGIIARLPLGWGEGKGTGLSVWTILVLNAFFNAARGKSHIRVLFSHSSVTC